MNQPLLQPIPVNPIEAMYALESMGRGAELTRLMELELPRLDALLSLDHPSVDIKIEHQMLRLAMDYVLRLLVLKGGDAQIIDVYLNVSSSAFMVKFGAKQFSLITAKSIGDLVYQLIQKQDPKHPEMSAREKVQDSAKHMSL